MRMDGKTKFLSVGEPINPEAWMWYHRLIGSNRIYVERTDTVGTTVTVALPLEETGTPCFIQNL